jgi:hypothetical protein
MTDLYATGITTQTASNGVEPTDERQAMMNAFVRLDRQFNETRRDRDAAEERLSEIAKEREQIRGEIARALDLHRDDEPKQAAR